MVGGWNVFHVLDELYIKTLRDDTQAVDLDRAAFGYWSFAWFEQYKIYVALFIYIAKSFPSDKQKIVGTTTALFFYWDSHLHFTFCSTNTQNDV